MKTVDIKGKQYVEVSERIKYFREKYTTGSIQTEILSNEGGICLFKATVLVDGFVVATGHAYEKEGSTFINKTSYIENCETSAIGRALGIMGIGIDASVASADEVINAIVQQEKTFLPMSPQHQKDIKTALETSGADMDAFGNWLSKGYKTDDIAGIDDKHFDFIMKKISAVADAKAAK